MRVTCGRDGGKKLWNLLTKELFHCTVKGFFLLPATAADIFPIYRSVCEWGWGEQGTGREVDCRLLRSLPSVLSGDWCTQHLSLHSKQHLSLKLFLFLLLFLPFLSLFSDIFFALISLIRSKNTCMGGGRGWRMRRKKPFNDLMKQFD